MRGDIKVAKSVEELQYFLSEIIRVSNFNYSKVKLSSQEQWQTKNGVLAHSSGGFFQVNGLINRETQEEQLVLFQPQSALTGVLVCRQKDTVYLLLQARVEPGNLGFGQFAPTVQSTAANYLRLHGGKATSYIDFFIKNCPNSKTIDTTVQFDLGKRYFQKSKSLIFVEVDELLTTENNMIWVPLNVIAQTLEHDNYLNPDLRSLLSVFNWESYLCKTTDKQPIVLNSAFIQQLFYGKKFGSGQWDLLPLEQLKDWTLSDSGVEDHSKTGLSVGLYQCETTTREVNTWVQPLMESTSSGLVKLLMRNCNGQIEYLLSLRQEFGISGQQVVLPSYLIYPGESDVSEDIMAIGNVVAEFYQSEEGGRFIGHESIYQLCEVESNFEIQEDQYWVNAFTLKKLLSMSNTVSIQLRCISSLLIKILNPLVFDQ